MRIAAIFNIWADTECIFPYMIENIRPVVDGIIVVWSKKSNRGEVAEYDLPKDCILVQCEPQYGVPNHNELAKRNAGLEAAKKEGFTHFIMMDGDEGYVQADFLKQKKAFPTTTVIGSVCKVKTYFKTPTLTIGLDRTLVPFIQRLSPRSKYVLNYKHYPFAHDVNGAPQIDPTRRLNISAGIIMMDITMHHLSWIRRDYRLKLENSSANFKAHRSSVVLDDLLNAKDGYFCKSYGKKLVNCENIFNIPPL